MVQSEKQLRFFSSYNAIVNSAQAMNECLTSALSGEKGTDCDLIIFHTTMGHNFKELLAEAKKLSPNATVLGCTCAGVIGTGGVSEAMRALAIMAVKGDRSLFAAVSADNIQGENSFEIAQIMAKELKAKNPHINMMMLLASGIDIAADAAIDGIEQIFGPVPIFGGTSSDNMKALVSYQFFNDKVLERGAVLLGFADPTLAVVMRAHHGSVPVGTPMTVTKSAANRIFELDGKPAWPYLMQKLGLPETTHPGQTIPIAGLGEELSAEQKREYDNPHILRVIVKKDEKNQSFYMPVKCAVNTKLFLMQRNESLIFSGLQRMLESITKEIGNKEVAAVFHTDCGARGKEMFNRILKEEIVGSMQHPINRGGTPIPWLGMYGFGEFTLLGGKNSFHNYTTSIYALVRK